MPPCGSAVKYFIRRTLKTHELSVLRRGLYSLKYWLLSRGLAPAYKLFELTYLLIVVYDWLVVFSNSML